MNPGTTVRSNTHPSKGSGLVIAVKTIFGREYVDVFFEKTREKLIVPADDLVICEPPEVKLEKGLFSSADRFLLRLLMERIRELKSGSGLQSAGNFKIIPLPHQLLAVDFVLDRFKPRALIADEVGLGKTIEAALIYEEMKARGMARRALIIAPSGLCVQWQEELKLKFFEEFSIYDRETVLSLKKLHGEESNVWTVSDKIITSIDFIKPKRIPHELEGRFARQRQWHNKHVFEAALNAGFDVVIIDEAHKLTKDMSGEETARYKVGKAFSEAAPVLLLLTATPHQGDSAKFKNLLNLIDPYLFYRESDVTPENVKKVTVRHNKRAAVDLQGRRIFKQRITSLYLIERKTVENRIELELYDAVTGYVSDFYNLAYQQNDRTMMFLLLIYQRMVSSSSRAIFVSLSRRLESLQARRRQLAGGLDEPDGEDEEPSLDQLEELAAEEQLARLEQHVQSGRDKRQIRDLEMEISHLQRCVALARRATLGRNDAKFVKLLEVIDEFKARENDPHLKFIIFTEFVETQYYLNECLQNLGYTTALINGRMSAREKLQQKKLFQEKAQFLISTDAGGEGINLQFCRVMINYDLPWNPMRLEQRIGRIDRIGQDHDVKVVNFQLAGTVEQYVREVIERKLYTVQQEFQDGEDKLADILSTLQDEFSFENIYINAVLKRQREAAELETLAQEIYRRARVIISEGQLLIPFTELKDKYTVNRRDLERRREQARRLVERYLQVEGRQLIPYRSKPGVYYFEDPLTEKRLSNVIFDARYALDNEDFELLSLSHPYVERLVEQLEESLAGDVTAKLQMKEKRFAGEKGYLLIYRLTLANYVDRPREYVIPCFVGVDGSKRERITRWFAGRDDLWTEELAVGSLHYDLQPVCCQADAMAEQRAEELFYELSAVMEQELQEAEQKMQKYYADKEESIRRVAVDNIQEAKLRELEQDRWEKRRELDRRRRLAPSLERLQIAYVEFDQ
jgi:superfamily II DNA or RNA helicase